MSFDVRGVPGVLGVYCTLPELVRVAFSNIATGTVDVPICVWSIDANTVRSIAKSDTFGCQYSVVSVS